ncbi:MAG TPA: hypothetical protein VHU81_09445 [Thermoanaerobaculia bacterium]|nr:hypothetical protein [Thermoanaerobaculia bacterium]
MRTTDRHIDIGPHRHSPHSPATDADDRPGAVGVPAAAEPFDQEINLRGVFWTTVGLVVITVVSAVLMWFMLRGFSKADERRDPPPSPMGAQAVQPAPPEPRLQTDDKGDLVMMHAEENAVLDHPAWVSQEQGSVRVPIDVAMQVIASRGLAPQVVGGTPGAAAGATPQEVRQNLESTPEAVQQTNAGRAPAALVQSARPNVAPAQPRPPAGNAGQQPGQSPPQP